MKGQPREANLSLPRALRGALESASAPKPLSELSAELHVSEKELPPALQKLARTLSRAERQLRQLAPICLSCGFEFRDRAPGTRPSRCPRCRSERIQPARYWIE